MLPFPDLIRPDLCYSYRAYNQHPSDLEPVPEEFLYRCQCNHRLPTATVEKDCCLRMTYDKIRSIRLVGMKLFLCQHFMPPIMSGICPGSSMTYTGNPRLLSFLCLATCSGLGFFPGAFSSTKAIFPLGNKQIRSGTPVYPGDTNFRHKPPALTTCCRSLCSTYLSNITLFLIKCVTGVARRFYNFPI